MQFAQQRRQHLLTVALLWGLRTFLVLGLCPAAVCCVSTDVAADSAGCCMAATAAASKVLAMSAKLACSRTTASCGYAKNVNLGLKGVAEGLMSTDTAANVAGCSMAAIAAAYKVLPVSAASAYTTLCSEAQGAQAAAWISPRQDPPAYQDPA